jgi:hypothetical protein
LRSSSAMKFEAAPTSTIVNSQFLSFRCSCLCLFSSCLYSILVGVDFEINKRHPIEWMSTPAKANCLRPYAPTLRMSWLKDGISICH